MGMPRMQKALPALLQHLMPLQWRERAVKSAWNTLRAMNADDVHREAIKAAGAAIGMRA